MSEDDIPKQHAKFETQTSYFSDILDSLDAYRNEGQLIVKDDNIYSAIADPANVAMAVSRIKGKALNYIEVNNTDRVEYGISFDRATDMLKGVSSTSDLEIILPVQPESSRYMRMNVLDEDIVFDCPLLNPNEVPKPPESSPISHETRIVLSGTDLKKNINHASKILDPDQDPVVFETKDNTLQMKSSNVTGGSFKKTFYPSGPQDDVELENHKTEIAYNYLDDIKQIIGSSDEVTVHVRDDYPLRLDLDLDSEGDASIIYIIAPRVDNQG